MLFRIVSVEQEGLLGNQGDLPPQGTEGDRPDVRAVDGDPSRRGVMEPGKQAGQGALAGAAGPRQRQDLARAPDSD